MPNELMFPVNIQARPNEGVPMLTAEFGRVTVILGANGAGKSRLMKYLNNHPQFGSRQQVYVEGGRVLWAPPSLMLDHTIFNEFNTLEKARAAHGNKRAESLNVRARYAFLLLDRLGQETKQRHSDAVQQWKKDGCQGQCPDPEEPPLHILFRMFHKVFPTITLQMLEESKNLFCSKNGSPSYSPNDLSDGERQVLCLLADIALLAHPGGVVLVDEPELNLHPALACRVWDTIEAQFPDGVFVYATHSINFAMRTTVNRVITLSTTGTACEVRNIREIDRTELREFLGAIPAILAAPAALVVEGDEDSIDRLSYAWLLGAPEVAIVPVGSSHDVIAAGTRTGVWDRLAPGVKLVGVLDRDFRSDDYLAAHTGSCVVLPSHEAESLLCQPDLIYDLAQALSLVAQIPSRQDIEQGILRYYEPMISLIAVQRTIARTTGTTGLTLAKQELQAYAGMTTENLRSAIAKRATEQQAAAAQSLDQDTVLQVLDEELAQCNRALSTRNIPEILRLAPGKELLATLARLIGCRGPGNFVRAAAKHLQVSQYAVLQRLRADIRTQLGI